MGKALAVSLPMTKHLISGPDALPFMNRLATRDVAKIKPGRVGYTVWCDDAGQVIDDGTIFHLEEGVYRLCSQEHQIDWLMTNALGFDVTIVEDTHDVAGLAVQGPTSFAVLQNMNLPGIENLTPFGIAWFDFGGTQLMVSRTGFTGLRTVISRWTSRTDPPPPSGAVQSAIAWPAPQT